MAGAAAGLDYRNTVDHLRILKKSVRMRAYDKIDAPVRVQKLRKFFVLLVAYVRKQNGKVDLVSFVVVDYGAHLRSSLPDVHEAANYGLGFGGGKDFLGDYAYKHNFYSVNIYYLVGLEQSGVVALYIQVRVNYGKPCAFLQEE